MKIKGIPLHDLHLHTGLSGCSTDKGATPETYAPIAAANGVELIGITDHAWDHRVKHPGEIGWYAGQSFERQLAHMCECERVQHGVRILYGIEAELFSGVLGIHETSAALLDYVMVAHSHFHQGPHALPEEYHNHKGVASYMMETFDRMVDDPLTTLSAHPFDPCIMNTGEELEDIFALVGEERFIKSLERARDRGVSIEINFALGEKPGTATFDKTFLWMWRLAKRIGCRFHFGSDSHTREKLAERTRPEVYGYYIDAIGLTPADMHPICLG